MRRLLFAIVATVLLIGSVRADDSYKEINDKAVKLYESGEFDRATTLLEEARDKNPADPVVNYNLGSAYHQQGEYDNANETYLNSALSEDSIMRAHSYYNMGNTEFRKGDYQKALDAYKKSIDIDPTDLDAKYNLELTRQKLQEQEQQQCDKNQEKQEDQQEDQEQNQDQQDQQQQEDQQNQQEQDQQNQQEQDQQEQQQQQDDQQQEDQQDQQQDQQQEQSSADQDDGQQPQQSQSKEMEMSEEDAERLLNAVTGNDRDVLKKLVKLKAPSGGYSGKDW